MVACGSSLVLLNIYFLKPPFPAAASPAAEGGAAAAGRPKRPAHICGNCGVDYPGSDKGVWRHAMGMWLCNACGWARACGAAAFCYHGTHASYQPRLC